MNFFIETYGCQMNKADSLSVIESLKKKGYQQAASPGESELIIINTCSVRKTAENRIWGRIGYYKNLKKNSPHAMLVLIMGCMSQRLGEELIKNDVTVDIVIGTYFKDKIPALLEHYQPGQKLVLVDERDITFYDSSPDRENIRKAFVTISHGCNNFCSYCIVPYVRGREKSRASSRIIHDINQLVARGVWQVTLLGQNVNSYGRDSADISFPGLLKKICRETDVQWIKFLSSHPRDFTDELIAVMAEESRVANWLHLAVQSGSNAVLKQMNRNYRIEDYVCKVDKLKSLIPQLNLTTDIIVGFPGETEADFQQTYQLVKELQFDDAYLYKYNIRENTVAQKQLSDDVPEPVKHERLARLIELQRKISFQKKTQRIGQVMEVMAEKWSKNSEQQILGLTKIDLMLIFPGKLQHFEKILRVRVTGMNGNTLSGEIQE